jgi:hypothetical protein
MLINSIVPGLLQCGCEKVLATSSLLHQKVIYKSYVIVIRSHSSRRIRGDLFYLTVVCQSSIAQWCIQALLVLAMQTVSLTFLSLYTESPSFDSFSFSILASKPQGSLVLTMSASYVDHPELTWQILFFPLEPPENIFIDSDTFFVTSITLETCIRTNLHQKDVKQEISGLYPYILPICLLAHNHIDPIEYQLHKARRYTSKSIAEDVDTFINHRADSNIVEFWVNIPSPISICASWAMLVPIVWKVWTCRPDFHLQQFGVSVPKSYDDSSWIAWWQWCGFLWMRNHTAFQPADKTPCASHRYVQRLLPGEVISRIIHTNSARNTLEV